MDFAPLIEQDLRAFLNDVFRRVRDWLDPFETALDAFVAELFSARLPANWRERWRQFVAEQAAAGFVVVPECATVRGLARSLGEVLRVVAGGGAEACGTQPDAFPLRQAEHPLRPVLRACNAIRGWARNGFQGTGHARRADVAFWWCARSNLGNANRESFREEL